ncbi:ABC transporter substrate-binding protein [Thermincola ferriacetica]
MLVFVTLIALCLTGCGKTAGHKQVVRVGYFPNITHGPALIGFAEKRFAKELGSSVELQEKTFVAGPALMEALIAGEVDIGYIGPIPAINGYVQGADISIISGANNGGAVLVAGENSGIKKVADLAGKKVAVPQFANTQDISLRHILKEHNLKDVSKGGTVEILQVAPADMQLLFSRNQIDAALVPEPWGTQLVKDAKARIILEWNEVWNNGNYPTTVIIARNEFIMNKPEIIKKWLEVHREIVKYAATEPEKARNSMSRQLKKLTGKKLKAETLKSAVERCKFTAEIDPATIREFATLSYEAGYLKFKPNLTGLLSYPKEK